VNIWQFFQIVGAVCLGIVALTHVVESFHIFSGMGWGLSNSPGHYLDLMSAVLGCSLLPLGIFGAVLKRRKGSPRETPFI
jgi:hypothetical protein